MNEKKIEAVRNELKLIAKELYAAEQKEMTKELAQEIQKGAKDLKKELDNKGTNGIAGLYWTIEPYLFENPLKLTVNCSVQGGIAREADDLKKYVDAFNKADQAYQNGKKKVEAFAKKYGFKIEWIKF